MSYLRYIKISGKTYGPYVYHSKKINGKVISEYRGKPNYEFQQKSPNNYLKILPFVLIFFFIEVIFFGIYFLGINLTGNAALNLETEYFSGEKINGDLMLVVTQGELIPADAKLLVNNSGEEIAYLLKDLVSISQTSGDFYVENTLISGSGNGYGVAGEKLIYPDVNFTMRIISNSQENNKEVESIESETNQQEANEEKKIKKEAEKSITGEVAAEFTSEANGSTSKNSPFTYQLQEGQTAEIINSDYPVVLTIENNAATVTTEHSEIANGFGEDFIGADKYQLIIDLNQLNLTAKSGRLILSLIYEDKTIVSAEKQVSISEETINQSINETLSNKTVINQPVNQSNNQSDVKLEIKKLPKARIKLWQPVVWTANINIIDGNAANITIELPSGSENININKIENEIEKEVKQDKFTITGNVIKGRNSLFSFKVTGKAIENLSQEINNESIIININDNAQQYIIEYTTPAPTAEEENISQLQKKVVISAPEQLNYSNVLAYIYLPKEARAERIRLYHLVNGIKENIATDNYDLNKNGLIDYIEWNVEHLSNQTYIIVITNAEHLDENRTFISDIYEYVKELDGNWSEAINPNEYIRVVFERNLTNKNDITIYAGALNNEIAGNIEVYKENGSEVLARFDNILNESYYKIYLTNLSDDESYSVFDLKILDNSVKCDYIVDPFVDNSSLSQIVYDCGILNTTGAYYTINQTLYSNNTCLNITANNSVINGNGNTIWFANASLGYGVYASGVRNVTIKNFNITQNRSSIASTFGIYFITVTNSTIINNTILTSAGNSNAGIKLQTNSNNNNITRNVIDAFANSGVSYGMEIQSGGSNNTVSYNIIKSNLSGSSYSYGIFLNSAGNNNSIIYNNITTISGGALTWNPPSAGAGIWVSSPSKYTYISGNNIDAQKSYGVILNVVSNNTIYLNNISISGIVTQQNYPVYLWSSNYTSINSNTLTVIEGAQSSGVYFIASIFNNVSYNNITVNGTGSTNNQHGINDPSSTSNNNLFAYNNILINGTLLNTGMDIRGVNDIILNNNIIGWISSGGSYGLFINGANISAINNNISRDGPAGSNYGVVLGAGAKKVLISSNIIFTNGLGSLNYGILDQGSNNTIYLNNITTNGSGIKNFGIHLDAASNSNISYNTILTYGSNLSHGIMINISSQNSSISNNIISTNSIDSNGIMLLRAINTTLINNTFGNITLFKLNISSSSIVLLIDQPITNYSFFNVSDLKIRDSTFGIIEFSAKVNGTKFNLSSDIQIMNNSVFVNASNNPGLNSSANITLFGIGNRGFNNPSILRKGFICSSCFNYTNLTADNVVFNVSFWFNFNYSIGNPPIPFVNFSFGTENNGTFFNRNWIFANVTYSGIDFSSINFTLFNLTGIVNSILFTTEILQFNWTNLSEAIYYYNATVLDRDNAGNSTEIRTLTLDRTSPNVINLSGMPPNNDIGGALVMFNWSVSDSLAVNLTCYPTIDSILNSDNVRLLSNPGNSSAAVTLAGGQHIINITCFDNANNSAQSTGISYLVAVINVSSPVNLMIIRFNSSTNFTINEIDGKEFLNNFSMTVYNSSSFLSNISPIDYFTDSYYANFSWNSSFFENPAHLTVHAVAFNNTQGYIKNVTSLVNLVLLKMVNNESIANYTLPPSLAYACPNITYNINGSWVNFNMFSDLDTLIYSDNITIIDPDNIYYKLVSIGNLSDSINYTNYFNYSFLINKTGTYNISASVRDYEWQNSSWNYSFYSYAGQKTVRFNSSYNFSINDNCNARQIIRGNDITLIVPNNSLLNLKTEFVETLYNVSVYFRDINITNNISDFINYTSLTSQVTPPAGQRRVVSFGIISTLNYTNYTLSLDYTTMLYSLNNETALKLYKCDSLDSCTFTRVNDINIDTPTHILSTTLNTMSVFLLSEDGTSSQIVSVPASGGRSEIVYANIQIVAADKVTMSLKDKIIIPIKIINPSGDTDLTGITLSTGSNTKDLFPVFAKNSIPLLKRKSQETVNLIIESHSIPGDYEIGINASSFDPKLYGHAKIFIRLVENIGASFIIERVVLVEDLFKENPKCLEFNDFLIEAKKIQNQNPQKAMELLDNAISKCRDLVTSKEDLIRTTTLAQRIQQWQIPIIASLIFLIVSLIIVIFLVKRRPIAGGKTLRVYRGYAEQKNKPSIFLSFKLKKSVKKHEKPKINKDIFEQQ